MELLFFTILILQLSQLTTRGNSSYLHCEDGSSKIITKPDIEN